MTTLFADTFYWVALLNRGDAAHGRATAFPLGQSVRLLTTEWVLVEVADALSDLRLRRPVVSFIRSLRSTRASPLRPTTKPCWSAASTSTTHVLTRNGR
jgi:predicted nucleic acid-binding protein